MNHETIKIGDKEYYFVPKVENDNDIIIELTGVRIKKIHYVRTQGMWGKDFDEKLINEHENNDLRCQIAEQNASGYYLMYNGLRIDIKPNSRLSEWPNGLYDIQEILLARLFKAQRSCSKINSNLK